VSALVLTLIPVLIIGALAAAGGGSEGPWRLWAPGVLLVAWAAAACLRRRAAWPWPCAALAGFVLLQTTPIPAGWTRAAEELAEELALAGIALRGAISFDASETAIGALVLAAAFGAYALAQAGASRSLQAAVAAAGALAAAGAVETFIGAGQYASGLVAEGGDAVARGTFTSRAHFSAFLLGGFGAALGLGSAALASSLRQALAAAVACWTVAGVCAVGVALSLSRAGILAVLAQVLVAVWWLVPRKRRAAAFGAAAAVGIAVAALAPQTQRLATERFAELAESKGDPGRLAIWSDTTPLLARHAVLGVGLEAYPRAFRRSETYFARKTVHHAHSDPLEFATELGIPFAALLLGSVLWIGAAAVRGLKRLEAPERVTAGGCLLGAGGMALQSLVDSPLHLPATALAFATLLGLGCGLALKPRKPSPTRRWTGVATALLVLANAAWWAPQQTENRFLDAEKLLAEGRTVEAAAAYREMLAASPFAAPAWQRLAGIARAEGRDDEALRLTRAAHHVEPHTMRTTWPLAEAELVAGEVEPAVERLARLADAETDLRPAAYRAAYRGGASLELIESQLTRTEPYAAGEYLAFLTRIEAWERWPTAYAKFESVIGERHREYLAKALAERGL